MIDHGDTAVTLAHWFEVDDILSDLPMIYHTMLNHHYNHGGQATSGFNEKDYNDMLSKAHTQFELIRARRCK